MFRRYRSNGGTAGDVYWRSKGSSRNNMHICHVSFGCIALFQIIGLAELNTTLCAKRCMPKPTPKGKAKHVTSPKRQKQV
ncbi:hypothetical protein RA876_16560 [Rhodoferax antarcticus]|nr:hypothetical protein RA876_16560 [Rhodoferax antarcticus]